VVNARQKKVNTDYHSRAKSLDARGGDTRDGFEAELNSYGQGGRVLGPVVGAFGEMSDDVKELANAVAEKLAVEHCSSTEIRLLKWSKASSSTNFTAPGDILSTADGHGSSSTAVVWCRFPMPHAVGHAQTIRTTRRISWRATSTRRATITLAQGHRESPVLTLISITF